MKYLISISFLLFASYFVEAQNISVEVSANEVGVGEAFLVTYNVDGNAQNFSVPEVKDFKIYESGKSTSVSIASKTLSSLNIPNFCGR